MKCVSYSLFGFNKDRYENCFDFVSYLRSFMINVRLASLIYPDWIICLETDENTYNHYKSLFDKLDISVHVNENNTPLCKAMLWRLRPSFDMLNGKWKYSHVICRDLDSPLTYREAQAVHVWINNDKAVHAITDSISHTIPLMGGMIGVRPDYFNARVRANTWEQLMSYNGGIDFNRKGSDQDFLNRYVYPLVAQQGNDSITQHYFKGHPNTFLSDFHTCTCEPEIGHSDNCVNNIMIPIAESLKESNCICGHIGASGYNVQETMRFLQKHKDRWTHILEAERQFPAEFHWIGDGTFNK